MPEQYLPQGLPSKTGVSLAPDTTIVHGPARPSMLGPVGRQAALGLGMEVKSSEQQIAILHPSEPDPRSTKEESNQQSSDRRLPGCNRSRSSHSPSALERRQQSHLSCQSYTTMRPDRPSRASN